MIGMNHSDLDKPWPKTTWVRCWDIQCDPARIHLGRHQYDWSRLDRWFDKAESIGAKTLYVIHGTPAFNAVNPTNKHNAKWMPAGANSAPANLNIFNEFVHALVTRYKGRLDAIEIGNEAANLVDFWYPINNASMKTLAKMHERAYRTAKSIDPNIRVIANCILPRRTSGGIRKAQPFIDAMAAAGWPCDAVSCHLYPLPRRPDKEGAGANYPEFRRDYRQVKRAVRKAGGPYKKLWVTEWSIDLLKTPMSDAKAQNIIRKIRTKHKGFTFFYAWDRKDLKGMYVGPGTLAWSEMEKMV